MLTMDADAQANTAKARAEARRQKILARQKDRLTSITGTYSKQEDPTGGCDIGSPVAEPAQPTDAVQSSTKPQQAAVPQQPQADQAVGQEQLQALMAAMERQLQHAQAMQSAGPQVNPQAFEILQRSAQAASRQQSQGGVSNASSTTAADALQSLLGSAAATASADSAAADQQATQQQQPSLLLQLGPALARSVKHTQLFRLLAAMLLAYAVLTGWQVGLPPVALLVVTDLAIVLAGAAVLPAGKAWDAAGAGDMQVPWRLRNFDVINFVPGLRQLMDSLKGYNAVATAVSQDFAAFVVVAGLLLSTNSVPAAVNWGLRY